MHIINQKGNRSRNRNDSSPAQCVSLFELMSVTIKGCDEACQWLSSHSQSLMIDFETFTTRYHLVSLCLISGIPLIRSFWSSRIVLATDWQPSRRGDAGKDQRQSRHAEYFLCILMLVQVLTVCFFVFYTAFADEGLEAFKNNTLNQNRRSNSLVWYDSDKVLQSHHVPATPQTLLQVLAAFVSWVPASRASSTSLTWFIPPLHLFAVNVFSVVVLSWSLLVQVCMVNMIELWSVFHWTHTC